MPAGNGTGPTGAGSMTGRAAGYCASNSTPGYMNSTMGGGGRGVSRGQGRGNRGCRRGSINGLGSGWGGYGGGMTMPVGIPTNAPTAKQEMDALKGQSEGLKSTLSGIQKRIKELEEKK